MALTWPLRQEGDTGEDVKSIQFLLTAHGNTVTVDGIFGSQTKTAVEHFQSAHGLTVDGIVGQQTWPQLIIQVSQGSNGDAVRAVQSQFHSRVGTGVVVDGIFGQITDQAVRGFQSLLGITVDGVVGANTWNHLVNRYFPAHDPRTAAKQTFTAWENQNKAAALKNATPGAVHQLFSHPFSTSDGWTFENCQGAAGTVFCSWRRSNGHQLRIGVEDETVAPVFATYEVEFA